MENQTPQEKKTFFTLHGKKKRTIIAVIAVLLLVGLVGRGFAFHGARGNKGFLLTGAGNAAVAAKDFESMGIVFAETAAVTRNGYSATYNALIKEAAQKGADTIINVNISSTGVLFGRTWSGSALAIKYLDKASGETNVLTDIANTVLLNRGGRGFGINRF